MLLRFCGKKLFSHVPRIMEKLLSYEQMLTSTEHFDAAFIIKLLFIGNVCKYLIFANIREFVAL